MYVKFPYMYFKFPYMNVIFTYMYVRIPRLCYIGRKVNNLPFSVDCRVTRTGRPADLLTYFLAFSGWRGSESWLRLCLGGCEGDSVGGDLDQITRG